MLLRCTMGRFMMMTRKGIRVEGERNKMSEKSLLDFLDETIGKVKAQLEQDNLRWGNTWKKRPREGQEDRVFARFKDYYDQFKNAGTPIPWTKVIGEAHIAMVREDHPEELEQE